MHGLLFECVSGFIDGNQAELPLASLMWQVLWQVLHELESSLVYNWPQDFERQLQKAGSNKEAYREKLVGSSESLAPRATVACVVVLV